MLYWNSTLVGKLLNLRSTAFLPVLDVWVVANTERTTLRKVSTYGEKYYSEEALTVKMMVRTLSSNPDVLTAS